MGKVFYEMSMSLDGFVTAANVRPEAGLGDGGDHLHEWCFKSEDPRNQAVVEAAGNVGVVIVGRNTYDLSVPYWHADGPLGALRAPTIVVTHQAPADAPVNGVYIFVNGVEAAVQRAKQLAGDKDISVGCGPQILQDLLKANLLDEIVLHVVPFLFGGGVRFVEELGGEHVQLEPLEVIDTKEVTHLRYRVIK
jgi:dihydrofolate reductase